MSTSSDRAEREPTQTFPATSGRLTGWIGVVVIAALLVEMLVHDPGLREVRWALVLVAAALLIYAFLLRPCIGVRGRTLVLVNPFEDIEIPLGRVDLFEVRSATFVQVGRKRYIGVAIGRKLRTMTRGQGDGVPTAPMMFSRLASAGGPEPTPELGTIDLLEDKVRQTMKDAKHLGETHGEVRRTPVWWLVAALVVVLVALGVTFLF